MVMVYIAVEDRLGLVLRGCTRLSASAQQDQGFLKPDDLWFHRKQVQDPNRVTALDSPCGFTWIEYQARFFVPDGF